MKSKSYPDPSGVTALISAAEHLAQLENDKTTAHARLSEAQGELRKVINQALWIQDDPGKSLAQLLKDYHEAAARDRQVDDLIREYENLKQHVRTIGGKITECEKVKTEVREMCEKVAAIKLTEYEALLSEIIQKLIPYCGGNEEDAHSLAQQTVAATELYSKSSRCRLDGYDPKNLLAPLHAVRAAIKI